SGLACGALLSPERFADLEVRATKSGVSTGMIRTTICSTYGSADHPRRFPLRRGPDLPVPKNDPPFTFGFDPFLSGAWLQADRSQQNKGRDAWPGKNAPRPRC